MKSLRKCSLSRRSLVYKVPTRTTLAGYKAGEWGDLAQPLWKGRMRIIETSKSCAIRLEDANTGEYDRSSLKAVYSEPMIFAVPHR